MRIWKFVPLIVFFLAYQPTHAQILEPAPIVNDGAFAAADAYSAGTDDDALLIYRDGVLVYETYRADNPTEPHVLHSGTKSFSCAIAVRAQMDGLLTLEEPVANTITEWADDPVRATITIRQLLTLTSGLPGLGAVEIGRRRVNMVERVIHDVDLIGTPGEVFAYGSSNYFLFAEVMRRKLNGEDAWAYLTRTVLNPLGINVDHGADGASNIDLAAQGMTTAREWARYGQLILQNGVWDGLQLLDPILLSACFHSTTANTVYGLTWWLGFDLQNFTDIQPTRPIPAVGEDEITAITTGERVPQVIIAGGAQDQRLIIMPSLRLVVVRFARGDRNYSDAQFLEFLIAGAAQAS